MVRKSRGLGELAAAQLWQRRSARGRQQEAPLQPAIGGERAPAGPGKLDEAQVVEPGLAGDVAEPVAELWADRDLCLIARVEDHRQVSPVTASGQGAGAVIPSIDGEAGPDCSAWVGDGHT